MENKFFLTPFDQQGKHMSLFIVNRTIQSPDECGVSSPTIENYYVPKDKVEELYAHAEHGVLDDDPLYDFLDNYSSIIAGANIIGVINIAIYCGSYKTISWELMEFGSPLVESNLWSNEGSQQNEEGI